MQLEQDPVLKAPYLGTGGLGSQNLPSSSFLGKSSAPHSWPENGRAGPKGWMVERGGEENEQELSRGRGRGRVWAGEA